MRRVFFCIFREVKKKRGRGYQKCCLGISRPLFFFPSCISVVCRSSFIVHALTFRKFMVRSRSHHHDTITFHVQYAQHPPLPRPSPTLHDLPLFLSSPALYSFERSHFLCARSFSSMETALRVDTALLRLASCGKRKGIWQKR